MNTNNLTLYGEYNWSDPIYKILRRETTSPRFKVFMIKQNKLNLSFYQFTDAKAFKCRGGFDLDDLFRKYRQILVKNNIIPISNQKMKNNFKEKKSPYEDLEATTPDTIWCG